MLTLKLNSYTSSRRKGPLLIWGLPSVFLILFGSTMSMNPPMSNPYRDFSKLRLEQPKPSPIPMTISTTTRRPSNYYYSTGLAETAATENVGAMMFKPLSNYHEHINMNSYTPEDEDEDVYEMNPSVTSQTRRPPQHQGDEEHEMPMPIHNNNGGGGSGGHVPGHDHNSGPGGIDYGNDDKNQAQHFGKGGVNHPDGFSSPQDDMFFIPAPPSQSFINEIEYDSSTGTLHEKGSGGLYENNPEQDLENPDYFYNNPDQQDNYNNNHNHHEHNHHEHNHHENSNQDRRDGDGYDQGGNDPGYGHGGISGNTERFHGNRDYGDY